VLTLIRGKEVEEIEQLKRQGLSIKAISQLTGCEEKISGGPNKFGVGNFQPEFWGNFNWY
jgi:hypothetical protein